VLEGGGVLSGYEAVAGPGLPANKKRRGLIIAVVVISSTIALIFVAAVILRVFVFDVFYTPSTAMAPALKLGDRIVVNELSDRSGGAHIGDIVVFATPANEHCGGTKATDLVKRVVGLPGESISLSRGSKKYLLIDGRRLNEPWLSPSENGSTYPGPSGTPYGLTKPYVIPPNTYYVLGDNRTDSCDSRYWGPVPKSTVVGKVVAIVWPLSRLRSF
jgi:signal peptidase I